MQASQEVSGRCQGRLLDTGKPTQDHNPPGPAIHKAFTLFGGVIINGRLGCGDPEIEDLKILKRVRRQVADYRPQTSGEQRLHSFQRIGRLDPIGTSSEGQKNLGKLASLY